MRASSTPGGVAAAEVDVEHDEVGRAAVGDHEGVARRGGLADHRDSGSAANS
jgi:hypothetical protein